NFKNIIPISVPDYYRGATCLNTDSRRVHCLRRLLKQKSKFGLGMYETRPGHASSSCRDSSAERGSFVENGGDSGSPLRGVSEPVHPAEGQGARESAGRPGLGARASTGQ